DTSFHTITSHSSLSFFFNDTPPTELYTLSLHDALPIYRRLHPGRQAQARPLGSLAVAGQRLHPQEAVRQGAGRLQPGHQRQQVRSEEHTSELQSRSDLVCRLLLEKKKKD